MINLTEKERKEFLEEESTKIDSFVMYRSYYEATKILIDQKVLTEAEGFQIFSAICEKSLNNIDIDLDNPIQKAIYIQAFPQIQANKRKRKNGCKGGRPPKEKEIKTTGFENEKPNVNDNDNVNDNINDNVNDVIPPVEEDIIDAFKKILDLYPHYYDEQECWEAYNNLLTGKEYKGKTYKFNTIEIEIYLKKYIEYLKGFGIIQETYQDVNFSSANKLEVVLNEHLLSYINEEEEQ